MKLIKYLGNILYSLILLFILISGICNMSTFLGHLGIGSSGLNYIITISLSAFAFYMFARDIDNIYKSKEKNGDETNLTHVRRNIGNIKRN